MKNSVKIASVLTLAAGLGLASSAMAVLLKEVDRYYFNINSAGIAPPFASYTVKLGSMWATTGPTTFFLTVRSPAVMATVPAGSIGTFSYKVGSESTAECTVSIQSGKITTPSTEGCVMFPSSSLTGTGAVQAWFMSMPL